MRGEIRRCQCIRVLPILLSGLLIVGCSQIAKPPGQIPLASSKYSADQWEPYFEGGNWGLKDPDGVIVLPAEYLDVTPFLEDRAGLHGNDGWFVVDSTGRVVTDRLWDDYRSFHEGRAIVGEGSVGDRRFGFISRDGTLAIDLIFTHAPSHFRGGIAHGRASSGTIFIDRDGSVLGKYAGAESFRDGMAPVMSESRDWGFIDRNFVVVIPYRFDQASYFSSGLAAVVDNGQVGYIDRQGNWVVPPTYEAGFSFAGSVAPVKVSTGWVLIDRQGKVVSSPVTEHRIFDGLSGQRHSAQLGVLAGRASATEQRLRTNVVAKGKGGGHGLDQSVGY